MAQGRVAHRCPKQFLFVGSLFCSHRRSPLRLLVGLAEGLAAQSGGPGVFGESGNLSFEENLRTLILVIREQQGDPLGQEALENLSVLVAGCDGLFMDQITILVGVIPGQLVYCTIGPPAPNLGSPKLPAKLLKGLVTTNPVQLQPFSVYTNRYERSREVFPRDHLLTLVLTPLASKVTSAPW